MLLTRTRGWLRFLMLTLAVWGLLPSTTSAATGVCGPIGNAYLLTQVSTSYSIHRINVDAGTILDSMSFGNTYVGGIAVDAGGQLFAVLQTAVAGGYTRKLSLVDMARNTVEDVVDFGISSTSPLIGVAATPQGHLIVTLNDDASEATRVLDIDPSTALVSTIASIPQSIETDDPDPTGFLKVQGVDGSGGAIVAGSLLNSQTQNHTVIGRAHPFGGYREIYRGPVVAAPSAHIGMSGAVVSPSGSITFLTREFNSPTQVSTDCSPGILLTRP
jgi:hypothetical protein